MKLDKTLQQKIIKHLQKHTPMLEAIYIFGSFADFTALRDSDIDIAYLSQKSLTKVAIWELAQALSIILDRDVDLIDLKETNTIFRFEILQNGIQIYNADEKRVDKFEDLAYSFYIRFQEERKPIIDAILKDKKVLNAQ